jgi:hypothetical protein
MRFFENFFQNLEGVWVNIMILGMWYNFIVILSFLYKDFC